MDLSSIMQTLLSNESLESVSSKTGAPVSDVKNVLSSALPMLLNGANSQATNSETADSFTNALNQHSQNDTGSITSFFNSVDLTDGAKIVGHLLGSNHSTQTQALAQQTGVSTGNTNGILAAIAPLLMSLIGQQANNENNPIGISSLMSNLLGSGDMNSLLSGILGASSQSSSTKMEDGKPNQTNNGILGSILGLFK